LHLLILGKWDASSWENGAAICQEAEICVAGAATAEEQSAETVKEELEQVLEAAQEGKESEHSEEWLNDFSQ
jgi:hypothetical protein